MKRSVLRKKSNCLLLVLTSRVDNLTAKREKLMELAKTAKRNNRPLGKALEAFLRLELKRILQSVAMCDKNMKRQSVSSYI